MLKSFRIVIWIPDKFFRNNNAPCIIVTFLPNSTPIWIFPANRISRQFFGFESGREPGLLFPNEIVPKPNRFCHDLNSVPNSELMSHLIFPSLLCVFITPHLITDRGSGARRTLFPYVP